VITNAHGVFGRQLVAATMDDGTRPPARLVRADPIVEVAEV